MHCTLRSADRTLYDGTVDRIVARSPYGEFAVLDGHAALLAVLVAGPIRLSAAGNERTILCRRGTFELSDNRATVLVEQPYDLAELDLEALRGRLAELRETGESDRAAADEAAYLELVRQTKESHA